MAMAPAAATPMPNPTIPCSHSGVLKTLSLPSKEKQEKKIKIHKLMSVTLHRPFENQL